MGAKQKAHTLQSPYPESIWPVLVPEDEQTILELLYSLLEPIGQHKTRHVEPSKGQRNKKRKRDETKTKAEADTQEANIAGNNLPPQIRTESPIKPPAPPDILNQTRVGFNSIVRCLDPAARKIIDSSPHTHTLNESAPRNEPDLAAVFVDRSSTAEIVWAQFPPLIATACARGQKRIHLVPLPRGAATRLSTALGIPRAGLVGIGRDASGSRPLLRFLEETVPPVKVPWIEDALKQRYQQTKTHLQEKMNYQ